VEVNIFSPDFKAKSHVYYRQMRKERPVYPTILPDGQNRAWLVTTYKHAMEVLTDERYIKDPHVFPLKNHYRLYPDDYREYFAGHMLNSDPPTHTELRKFVQPTFTPAAIKKQRQQIEMIAHKLLDKMEAKTQPIDFISEFAFPLPFLVIAQMLGIPEKDKHDFQIWSNAIIEAINDPVAMKKSEHYCRLFFAYMRRLVAEKQAHPTDDLISAWISAREDGKKLSEDQLYAMILLLVLAGHETTVNLISNTIYALMQHRDQWEELKENNALIPNAIEESLRYYSPIEVTTARWASEDISLGGENIKQGDTVFVVLASINRDEELIENGDVFSIHRKPIKHHAFGHGIHFCLGSPLARLEGDVALRAIVNRLPNLQLAVPEEKLKYRPGFLLRGLVELPITY
jgi:cytochrome P450